MKIFTAIFRGLLPVLAVVFLSGCANQKTWVYHPNSYPSAVTSTEKKVVVLPFEDTRENNNQNLALICMIPLVPYGPQNLNTPEGLSEHTVSGLWVNYKPTEDFAKALADDLRNTHQFSDAFFDYRRDAGDYVVNGKILSTKYTGRTITYCLSCYGVYLWLLGLPACWTQNELSIELELVDQKAGKTLFSKTYSAEPQADLSWIYSLKSDFHYAEMLAGLNKQFCTDIQPILAAPEGQ